MSIHFSRTVTRKNCGKYDRFYGTDGGMWTPRELTLLLGDYFLLCLLFSTWFIGSRIDILDLLKRYSDFYTGTSRLHYVKHFIPRIFIVIYLYILLKNI